MGNKAGKNLLPKFWKSNKSSSSIITSSTEDINFETFLLVWLDPHVDTSEGNRTTQIQLRKILMCLITFDNIESCENWLKKCVLDEKIILIVSGRYGEKLVPKIHYLPSIISIYIYCLDVNKNKLWSKNYPKIRNVISNPNQLLKQLSMNQRNLESIEDFKASEIYSLDMKMASYIWYQLLLEIFLSTDYLPLNNTFHKLIENLREYSSSDEYGLNLISQFEQTYNSEQVISYLIDNTPLARFLNKALREQNIKILFLLRFLLIDIYKQLTKHQANSLNAFRIQPMARSQMENLLANPGQLLVFNGFLFATTNKSQLISTIINNDQHENVLINIKANYRIGVAPFAFLHDINSNIGEQQIDQEILFMCGSMFIVGPLICEDSIWTLELTLISDYDRPDLYKMKQQLKQTHNFCIIGDLLNHCGQSDQTITYYQQLLNELPKQHILIPQIDKQLSIISKQNLNDIRYILVDLSIHMTDFASSMLGTLCSLASDMIYIYNDDEIVDFSKWSHQSIQLFTTANFAKSLKNLPESFLIFTLENDDLNINKQNQCKTIEELISKLADEIIQKYRLNAYEYHKINELNKAKQFKDKANKIYQELIIIQKQFTTKFIQKKLLPNNIEPSLILLMSNDDEDTNMIKQYFNDLFSSYYCFSNEDQCHQYIVEHENIDEIFIMIIYYQTLTTNNFQQFSNVKYVYLYEKNQNQNNLYYQLILDLIKYYAELGDQYEQNNQKKIARNCFLKGQKLCQFLNEKFFSNK